MKKVKLQHPSDKMLVFIIVIILSLQTGILWYFGQKIDILWKVNNLSSNSMPFETRLMIQNAISNLYINEGVIDVKDQRVYIPELKIYLPLKDSSRSLVYTHDSYDVSTNFPEELVLNTKQVSRTLPQNFSQIPCMQRLVDITVILMATARILVLL
jgi:hypothetical protein